MKFHVELEMSRDEADYLFRVGLAAAIPECKVLPHELIDLDDDAESIEIDEDSYDVCVKFGIQTILNDSVRKAASKKGLQHDNIYARLS